MADPGPEGEYKQAFIQRVKAARIAVNMKQWQVAEALGMPQDRYKQYETRSLLPHHLIGRFCIVTHVDPEWLVTGRGQKPLKPIHVAGGSPIVVRPKRKSASRAA